MCGQCFALDPYAPALLPPPYQVAIVFGNERSGLSNDELKRCTETVAIPTAAVPSANLNDPLVQSSLNLSHAVTVLCYEVRPCCGAASREKGIQEK
jgi:tRNA C32,U32 (ribose-2'-O)-methylase TrmJ